MEKLKPFSELMQPDNLNSLFIPLDTFRPRTLEEHYVEVAAFALSARVPADVRRYFVTIQNVCIYAWFAFDLYAVADFLCLTAIEMALRKRIPITAAGKHPSGL